MKNESYSKERMYLRSFNRLIISTSKILSKTMNDDYMKGYSDMIKSFQRYFDFDEPKTIKEEN